MSLSELEAAGVLEPLAGSPEELQRMLDTIARRLDDARVTGVSNEARFELAYHAALGCALAALRANDYRVAGGEGKHFVALNTLEYTIGLEALRVRYLQKLRVRRNIDIYEGGSSVSDTELAEALAFVSELYVMTRSYVLDLRGDVG